MPQKNKNLPKISIVIPVYKDWNKLKHCLNALLKQTYPDNLYSIIVVNNHKNNKLRYEFPNKVVVLHEPRAGSFQARNHAIRLISDGVIAFTDADCIPDKNWLKNGVETLNKSNKKTFIGGEIIIYFKNHNKVSYIERYQQLYSLKQKKYIEHHGFAATANMFLWHKAFMEVGLFNGSLKSGGDAEWAERAIKNNYSGVYSENTVVYHRTRKNLSELIRRQQRTTGGHFARILKEDDSNFLPFKSLLCSYKEIKKIPKKIKLILSDIRIQTWHEKISIVLIFLVIFFFKIAEYIKLGFGGNARR